MRSELLKPTFLHFPPLVPHLQTAKLGQALMGTCSDSSDRIARLALDLRMLAGFDQQPIECRLRIVPFAPLPCLRTLCAYAHRSPRRCDFDGVGRRSI